MGNKNTILTIHEVANELHFKDKRSAIAFLVRHKIYVHKEGGSNLQYVLRLEFENALLKPLIPSLKLQYGPDGWLEAFKAHMNLNLVDLVNIAHSKSTKHKHIVPTQSLSKEEAGFYSDLTSIYRHLKSESDE